MKDILDNKTGKYPPQPLVAMTVALFHQVGAFGKVDRLFHLQF